MGHQCTKDAVKSLYKDESRCRIVAAKLFITDKEDYCNRLVDANISIRIRVMYIRVLWTLFNFPIKLKLPPCNQTIRKKTSVRPNANDNFAGWDLTERLVQLVTRIAMWHP